VLCQPEKYTGKKATGASDDEIAELDANMRVEVEDTLEDLANDSEEVRKFDKEVTFRGGKTAKARALARFS